MFYVLSAGRSKVLLNAKMACNAVMKENTHFFITRFQFPPFPISHFHFFVPGFT